MKYIIFQDFSDNQYPIIFPEFIQHFRIANAIINERNHKPVSAGFCNIKDNKFYVYGQSVTLKLQSKPYDKSLLNILLV